MPETTPESAPGRTPETLSETVLFRRPLVFVDLETTGANFARDRILEIGLIEVDENGVREWETLVDPGVPVTPFITGLTGIDDALVAGAPAFSALAEELRARLAGKLFIAHNARFDYGFLKGEFARLGIDFRASVVCTVKLSRRLFPQHARHNLDTLIERHGITVAARHRALADARVLWDLWQRWHVEAGAEAVGTALATMTQTATLPPSLDPALADDLPEAHGAYALLDAEGETLAIGRAANLRSKVLSLFAGNRAALAPANRVRHVEWHEAAGEFGARLHEIRLQRRGKPVSGELCAWRLRAATPGDFRPELVSPEEAAFGEDDDLFGLYATRREAKQALRKLAEAHFLCPVRLGLEEEKPGKPCSAHRNPHGSHHCRGVCAGKEAGARHGARLLSALARVKQKPWSYAGPVALVERDHFGMMEDFHLIDRWRHLGCAHSEDELNALLDAAGSNCKKSFDPDIYRLLLKYIQSGGLRLVTLPVAPGSPCR